MNLSPEGAGVAQGRQGGRLAGGWLAGGQEVTGSDGRGGRGSWLGAHQEQGACCQGGGAQPEGGSITPLLQECLHSAFE